ncbi:MAG: YgiT-type zinc finger protein, partial [Planctomycetota bacterium]
MTDQWTSHPRLKVCVSCGLRRVQRKRVSVGLRNGRTVTGVEADVCATCGERYFDVKAMRKLEAEAGHG